MTLLARARQNRLTAIQTRLDRIAAPVADLTPVFKSRRVAANLNHAPVATWRVA